MYVESRDGPKTGVSLSFDEMPRDGACKGKPTEWFFPGGAGAGSHASRKQEREKLVLARQVCNTCSIMNYCLEYSLRHEPIGVWGGMGEEERALLRFERGITLSREGRINFSGVGLRSANGEHLIK